VPEEEKVVLEALGLAWNASLSLKLEGDDLNDFRKAIHDAQRIVLAREGSRTLGAH
jgi:hypothetical protein